MLSSLLLYAVVGAFAGVLAGLFGVGGGLIIVPALVFVFAGQQVSGEVAVHLAIGTSLATIVFTSLSSIRAHHRRGAVLWPVVLRLAPGIVVGVWLGAGVAKLLPAQALRGVFGVFELLVALQMAFSRPPAPHRSLPGGAGMFAAGSLIGGVSALVGIGGGSLTVPFLLWCRITMQRAVATSSACGLPIALAGALGFAVTGWNAPGLPAWSSGFIYWPALLGIALFSVLTAPLGARLAHNLSPARLKLFFAAFLAVLGLKMLFF